MTRKPQTRKRNVLKINPTSAETVVSATLALLILSKSINAVAGVIIFFIIFLILSPLKLIKKNF
tara:strand:- start:101 stop:292 length:192 start_codon:yes stop_codon:yes gene_type:complete